MKRASPEDIPSLVSFMEEVYAESGFPLNHARAADAFATLLADEHLGCAWLIQADGQDVGYVVLTLGYSMEYGGRSAFVDDLFVRLPFRRRGLASAALAEVRTFCIAHSIRAVHVETGQDNAAALEVYRRVGFTATDRQLLTMKLADPSHAE